MSQIVSSIGRNLRKLPWFARNMGVGHLLANAAPILRVAVLGPSDRMGRLTSKYARFPLHFRENSSDLRVFSQIYLNREYRCLDSVDPESVELIVDCGANVGYASAYFLTRFPRARLVAVEPDSDNLKLLRMNLSPFSGRYTIVQGGIWSHTTDLCFQEESCGTGHEWGRRLRPCRPGEAAVIRAFSIADVLPPGTQRISIMKIDIEGSEAELLDHGDCRWLDQVDNMVMELHGPECERAFKQKVSSSEFRISRCDELTVCNRVSGPRKQSVAA